ncbi:putative 30S ribosomal protein S1 [Streptomyces sp. Tu6071]|nr:putative 30S ribosomal protein S1 [Streptomyces sp. Tu6071]
MDGEELRSGGLRPASREGVARVSGCYETGAAYGTGATGPETPESRPPPEGGPGLRTAYRLPLPGTHGAPGSGVSGAGSALAAGQLLAQGRERLVRGEGARVVTGVRGVRTTGAAAATAGARGGRSRLGALGSGLLVGLAGLDDLGLVLLEAGLGLGVLALPLLALLLVPLEPVVGLGVEALGVDVVALVVVGRGHAVQGRVELDRGRVGAEGLVGLLQREADAAALQVDVDDLDEDLVVDLDDLLRDLHVALGQLGDVDQALDALVDADERAEGNELGDLAGDDLTDLVRPGELLPRVFLRRLERQGDTLAVHVHVENLDGDFLADLDNLGGVVDVLPGQLGDVHEAVHATQVHEGTEVDDGGDDAGADLTLLEGREEGLAHLGLGLLQPGTAGQDHVVAVLVQLDDLRLELLAHVGLEVADAAHLDQGGREEASEADVEDETTLDDLDDGTGDDAVLFLDLLDRAPGALVLRTLLGQDEPTLLVLLLENKGLDLVADLDDLVGVDVVLDRKLAGGDDAFGLVTDVEQDLVPVDLHDDAVDDVAVVEVLDRLVDRGEEGFLVTDVVDRYLRGGGGGLGAARHVGKGSGTDIEVVGTASAGAHFAPWSPSGTRPPPPGADRLEPRDKQQMRAPPARSEERRLAAQLVAYGGSRTGSMREGAHARAIPAFPAHGAPLGTRRRRLERTVRRWSTSSKPPRPPSTRQARPPRTRPSPPRGVPRASPRAAAPTAAGGTATRTSTRPSTAPSSATTVSSGAPRGSTRWRRSSSALRRSWRARTSWRSARARRSARGGSPRRARAPSRWTWRTASSSTRCASPRSTPRASRSSRRTRARCPSPAPPSTWSVPRTGRSRSSPTRCGCCARCGACCGPAGASCSR